MTMEKQQKRGQKKKKNFHIIQKGLTRIFIIIFLLNCIEYEKVACYNCNQSNDITTHIRPN